MQSKTSVIGLLTTTLLTTSLVPGSLLAAPASDTRLADAARQGNTGGIRSLLKQKADVNGALGDGTTAAHWAAVHNNLEQVSLLVAAGANLKAATRVGSFTPLHLASKNGNPAVVEALLYGGADPNAASANGTTPLMAAAASGNVPTVLALLNKGADPNARETVYGQTPLMFAASKDREAVVRTLVTRGADSKLTSTVSRLARARFDEDGNPIGERPGRAGGGDENPAANTEGGGSNATRQRRSAPANAPAGAPAPAAQAADPDATPNETPAPQQAAGANRAGAPEAAPGRGVDRGPGRTFGGNSALTLAAREGHLAAIRALVESGADVNQPNAGDKTTPIVTAICNGHYDAAKYLLDHGANPNLASVDGLTALYATVDAQWAPIVWTPKPLTDQEKTTYLDLLKALLAKGADPNLRLTRKLWFRPTHHDECWVNSAGGTAFWRAAQATDLAAMRILLAGGADPKIETTEKVNALMVAAGLGWNGNFSVQAQDSALDTVKFCLELGLDPIHENAQGYTALSGAAYRGDNALVELLVQRGAKLDTRTARGWTLTDMANGPSLRSSVPVKHPETVALLLKLGAPPLTAIDDEEILGIIRQRPAARTTPGAPNASNATPAPAAPTSAPEAAAPQPATPQPTAPK